MKPNICDIIITLLLLGISCLLGWWSTIGEKDIISNISVNIVSILLPLLVLHTTLMIQLLNEMRHYANKCETIDFSFVIKSVKCNFIAEIIILFIAIVVLIGNQYLQTLSITERVLWNWIIEKAQIIANSFTIFAIFYFMWVIIDEIAAFLKLFVENNKKTI